jgi:hypothetical protein
VTDTTLRKRECQWYLLLLTIFGVKGTFVAKSLGMPDIPRVKLPHPVAGLGEVKIAAIADSVVETILDSFENE